MSAPALPSRLPPSIGIVSVTDFDTRIGVFGSALGFLFFSLLAGLLVASLAVPSIIVVSRGTNFAVGYFDSLPDYLTLDQQSQRNTIYANRDGQPVPIATIYDQNREVVGWDAISQYIKDATVAGEDRRFYQHGGVDLKSVVRAAVGNIVHKGITSGSSTIAMQLVKNTLIQRALQIQDPRAREDRLPGGDRRHAQSQSPGDEARDRTREDATRKRR